MTRSHDPIEPRVTRDHDHDQAPVLRPTSDAWDRTEASAAALLSGRDRVRWGPIFAGLVTALTSFMLLSLLAVGIGLTAADPAQADGEALATGSAIVSAVIGLAAFFLGGFVAGRAGAIVGRPAGALNGFLVWALGVVLILVLGALGLGALLGAAGEIIGQTGIPDVNAPQPDPQAAADTLRNSALVAFVSLLVPAIAASLGGALGAASDVEDRLPG